MFKPFIRVQDCQNMKKKIRVRGSSRSAYYRTIDVPDTKKKKKK